MSDYDSSLPVRTESAGDVDAFISDATTPSQKLKVNADGSIDTNTSLPSGTQVEITDGTDTLGVNADGSINVVDDALDASSDSVSIGDGTDTLDVNADGSINVVASATDLDIRDLVAASDSVAAHLFDEAGVAFSASNPLPVVQTSDQEGNEIQDYQTSASVAAAASVNHDYTVTAATTFIGEQVWASGSGKIKVEVLVNGATRYVGFNSTANPNVEIPLLKILKGDAAQVIRITITNRDLQAQDVYSTLSGLEV